MRRFSASLSRIKVKLKRSLGRVHRVTGTKIFVPNGTIAVLVVGMVMLLAIYHVRQTNDLDHRNDPVAVASAEYKVLRVIDGDTFVVTYDGEPTRVRIVAIDAPEEGQRGSAEATNALCRLIDGKAVRLSFPEESRRDRFGRLLANVEVDGIDVGAKLLNDQFVLPYRRP